MDARFIVSMADYLEKTGHTGCAVRYVQMRLSLISARERTLLGIPSPAQGLTLSARLFAPNDVTVLELQHTTYWSDRFIFLL